MDSEEEGFNSMQSSEDEFDMADDSDVSLEEDGMPDTSLKGRERTQSKLT